MSTKEIPLSRVLVTSLIKKGTDMTEAIGSVLKKEKVTIQQFNVLRILRGRKGEPASLLDVSKNMLHANSNTTRVIDKLVTKNYVERKQCPDDRRQIELTITQNGMDLLHKLDQSVDQKEQELIKNLNIAELHQIIGLLQKI